MRRQIIILLLLGSLFSCKTKSIKSDASVVETTNTYVSKIDNNKNLKEEIVEGALTDEQGFEDIGRFKKSVLFDKDSKALFRIKNIEISSVTITEHYYFRNHDLVYIVISSTSNQADKKIYTSDDKNVLLKENISDDEVKVYLKKAKLFKTAHYRSE